MTRIAVVVPSTVGPAHAEAITAARDVGTVTAVSLGEPDVEGLARFGVGGVVAVDLQDRPLEPAAAADAVTGAVRALAPDAVVLVSSFAGKAVAARLAVAFGSGAVVDATGLRLESGRIIASKTVLAGNWLTECTVERGLPIIAIKPSSVVARPAPVDHVDVTWMTADYSVPARALTLVSRQERDRSGRPPLDEARVVVAGGRGVAGDFSLVEALADRLGGAVGATRVATDEGWIDHSAQIGQTGTMIAPRLYIGVGISGAVHHTAGMQAAEVVVAVNSDPDAPIFEIADFGVVGDLNEVLPQVLAALRR